MSTRLPSRGLLFLFLIATLGCQATPAVTVAEPPPPASPDPETASPLAVGTKIPSFRLDRLDGPGAVGLPNGKVTIVTFIATWNAPAQKSLPKLQEIYLQLASKGLAMIAISVDDNVEGVREFAATNGAKYPLTWDKDHRIANRLRPPSMPTTLIVDRNGVLRFVHRGYHEGTAEEIARDAASLL